MNKTKKPLRGRATTLNPKNRFEELHITPDPDDDHPTPISTQLFRDHSQSILSKNDSPDLGFSTSINPYRGCEHGCAYCYARPTHEYLGFSSGIDFESRIMVKENAAELLRTQLSSKQYQTKPVALSGVTDCYQPIERKLRITRSCLEVLAEFRHPVTIVTKNTLVTRDIDLLSELARHNAVRVCISITSLDRKLAAKLEPRASTPRARLAALTQLNDANIPTGIMVAPIIPMLNEPDLVPLLEAGHKAGTRLAGYTVVRLPHAVTDIFSNWLDEHFPQRKNKILGRIEAMQGKTHSNPNFGKRLTGSGIYADQIHNLFTITTRRLGLNQNLPPLNTQAFRRTLPNQPELF